MPGLPAVESYLAALRPRTVGRTLARVRLASPFLIRTVDPPIWALAALDPGGADVCSIGLEAFAAALGGGSGRTGGS
jgi:hypothetical protein